MLGLLLLIPAASYLAWLDFSLLGLGPDPAEAILDRARVAHVELVQDPLGAVARGCLVDFQAFQGVGAVDFGSATIDSATPGVDTITVNTDRATITWSLVISSTRQDEAPSRNTSPGRVSKSLSSASSPTRRRRSCGGRSSWLPTRPR